MRVLILSALLAFATAAPSETILTTESIAPAEFSTKSPGDLQAAAIDAKTKAEDYAQALEDKKRFLADITKQTEELRMQEEAAKAETFKDEIKERKLETYWSVEDKKWQALDSINLARATFDVVVAGHPNTLQNSLVNGLVQPTAVITQFNGLTAPVIAPTVYAAPDISSPLIINANPIVPQAVNADLSLEAVTDIKKPELEKSAAGNEKIESTPTSASEHKTAESNPPTKVVEPTSVNALIESQSAIIKSAIARLNLSKPSILTTPVTYYQPGLVAIHTLQP